MATKYIYDDRNADLIVKEAMINGVLAGVSDRVGVYLGRLHSDRAAIIGLQHLRDTAHLLLEMIEKEFKDAEMEELQWPSQQPTAFRKAAETTDG